VVLPRIVHEGDARVDRPVHERHRLALGADLAEVKSTESEGGDALTSATEWTERNGLGAILQRSGHVRVGCGDRDDVPTIATSRNLLAACAVNGGHSPDTSRRSD
jgi:hypothetical protein